MAKCECFCIVAMMLKDEITNEVLDEATNMERKRNEVCWGRECTRLKMVPATTTEVAVNVE